MEKETYSEKKTYSTPKIEDLGNVESLTKGLEFAGDADNFLGFHEPAEDPPTGS